VRLAARFLIAYAFIAVFSVALALICMLPHFPKTAAGWFLLLILAPPVYVLMEGLGSVLLSDSLMVRWFGEKGRFSSVARIAYAVTVFVVLFVAIFIAWSQTSEGFREFLADQFW
jgi:hypothetical protein